ncbi:MAG: threonine/serine dehydratase [Acidobacteriota bacterium]
MPQHKFHFNLHEVKQAQRRLHGVARRTPLLTSNLLAGVFLKAENLQVTGSFKIRPAFNQMSLLSRQDRMRGVVTSSSGNFAQAVAFAARLLKIDTKVVMMKGSNSLKVERTRKWGAQVVFCGKRFEHRTQKVAEIQAAEDRVSLHPYDHPAAMAGNGTIALELLDQLPDVEQVVTPISGGGLIAGIALAIKSAKPTVKVLGVQPVLSNATWLSWRSGTIQSIEASPTIADGLRVTRPGQLTFPVIQHFVDEVVTVEETTILEAVRCLLEEERLVVEPSGAVPLAAILEGKILPRQTLLVLSGGNIEPRLLKRILDIKSQEVSPLASDSTAT